MLVCGIHNPVLVVVPLRWGSPRVVVITGGFRQHLGRDLSDKPFHVARLRRYGWDPHTDFDEFVAGMDRNPRRAIKFPSPNLRHLEPSQIHFFAQYSHARRDDNRSATFGIQGTGSECRSP